MGATIAVNVKGQILGRKGDREWLWTSLTQAETPEVAVNSGLADAHVQVNEESGTATLTLEGTDLDTVGDGVPVQFEGLLDAAGSAISFTADGRAQLQSIPKWIRPVITGTGTWTILLKARAN